MDKKEVPILRQAQDDIPKGDSDKRSSPTSVIAAGVSAAAVLAMTKEAQAAEPFDDAVNNINPGPFRETSGAQFTAGPTSDRFDMVFSARTPPDNQTDFYRAQLSGEGGGADGGVIFRMLGPAERQADISGTAPLSVELSAIEYRRPDGRRDIVQYPGIEEGTGEEITGLDMNGRDVWPSDCGGTFSFVHPSARTPRTLKVAVNFGEAFGAGDEDIYRVSIDAPVDEATGVNFCTDIRDRILAANAVPGGDVCTSVPPVLQCNAESSWVGDIRAPEAPEFEVVRNGSRNNILKWNPATDQYDIFMERGEDGCYTEECAPPYEACVSLNPEEGLGIPSALLTTPLHIDGREIYPYVAEYTTPAGGEGPYPNGRPHLEAMAFEITPGGTICEVPVTMEADEAAVVDDDNDGIANEDDTCAWVQEAGNIDASGPAGAADGIGDACQTACENWPAVNPPVGSSPSDFWACQSTEIQGYGNQMKRGDGSTLLTSFEVPAGEFDDGDLDLPPDGDFYWLHAQAAQYQGDEVASPSIVFPAGNSAHIEILSTDHPDGTPGTATFTHLPYPSGPAEETPIGVGTHDFDPGIGDVLGLSGTVVRGSAGEENWPIACDNGCTPAFPEGGGTPVCPVECAPPVVDGGTPDGGADGGGTGADGGGTGADGGGTGADGGGAAADGGADAGPIADAGPTCPPVCDPQPDGGTDAGNDAADAGTDDAGDSIDAGADPSDAGQDAGPADSGTTDTPDAANPSDANDPDQPDGQNPDPKPDSGPNSRFDGGSSHRADGADTGHDEGSDNGGGCSCTIAQAEHGHHAPLSMDGFSMMTPIIAALLLKRRARLGQFLKMMFTVDAPQTM